MPGTRTTQNVGPILGARYPIDADLVSDEVNLNEQDRTASGIVVYKKPQGQGKFEAVVVDAEGNERGVIIGATAAVAHASRHVVEEPSFCEGNSQAKRRRKIVTVNAQEDQGREPVRNALRRGRVPRGITATPRIHGPSF